MRLKNCGCGKHNSPVFAVKKRSSCGKRLQTLGNLFFPVGDQKTGTQSRDRRNPEQINSKSTAQARKKHCSEKNKTHKGRHTQKRTSRNTQALIPFTTAPSPRRESGNVKVTAEKIVSGILSWERCWMMWLIQRKIPPWKNCSYIPAFCHLRRRRAGGGTGVQGSVFFCFFFVGGIELEFLLATTCHVFVF